MSRDFFDPTPEQQNVTLIDRNTAQRRERLIESRLAILVPLDWILDRVTDSDPKVLHSGDTGEVSELQA